MGRPLLVVLGSLAVLLGGCARGIADDLTDVAGDDDPSAMPVTAHAARESTPAPEDVSSDFRPRAGGPLFRASSDGAFDGSLNTFARYEAAIQSDGTLTIATKRGLPGSDPRPTDYFGGSYYNGATFRSAIVVSPVWVAKSEFDRVTPSFEAFTPEGTWIEVRVSAHLVATNAWTSEYSLGVWARDESTVRRHSVAGQDDASAEVVTDTLRLSSPADALQVSITLFSADESATPRVRAVSAITDRRGASAPASRAGGAAWGTILAVPKQAAKAPWSSPASTSMLLGYWGVATTPPEAAEMSSDVVEGGTGNRSFNTAFAATTAAGKLHSMVTRLSTLADLEPLVAHEIPVAIGVSYDAGELDGAPLSSAEDHVLVVKGFSNAGDVVVNDPAFASDDEVETTYGRTQLATAWQRAGGAAYVVWPSTRPLPSDPLGRY